MKFGKVDNVEGIDFTLPPDDPTNSSIFSNSPSLSTFYIGATGWSMKEWKGIIYPGQAKANQYLHYYSRQFNSIEMNTTHYRLPKTALIEKWKNAVPDDFKFCPKVWKNISHRKEMGIADGSIKDFSYFISMLEEKLGPCFLQLPPYFDFSRLELLETVLKKFPATFQLAVEARHESFYRKENKDRFSEILRKYNCIWLITDVAGRRDILHSTLTTPDIMIRWVGNGLHSTDYSRINDWKKRIANWKSMGLRDLYFFPHQPDNLLTPKISEYVIAQMKPLNFHSMRGPKLADNNNQLSLL